VPETTKEEGDGEIPREVSDRIIADVRSRIDAKAAGFENITRAGKTLGVSQPSVTAWLAGKSRVSYKVARQAEEALGKNYLGDPRDTEETREWGMKWRALDRLRRDKYDLAESFRAVDEQKFDRDRGPVGWGDYYDGAKTDLDAAAPRVQESDIPLPPGPAPVKPSTAAQNRSGATRHTSVPPVLEAAADRQLRQSRQKSASVGSRKTSKKR
jgi:hypothetical protein